MARIELPIDGMTCEHCVRTLTDALEKVPGVRSAKVSLRDRKAVVESQGACPRTNYCRRPSRGPAIRSCQ